MKDLGFNYYSSPIHAHCSSGGLSRKMVISFHEVIVPETDSAHIEEPQMWTDHSEVNVCPCVWSSTMTTTIVLPLLNYSKSLCRSLQVVNFQRCELAPVCQLFDYTSVLFQVLFCKIKKCFLYFLCVFVFKYYLCEKWKWKSLSYVRLFATPWTVAHGILQGRILEWVAFAFSRGSYQPRDRTHVSLTAGGSFTS